MTVLAGERDAHALMPIERTLVNNTPEAVARPRLKLPALFFVTSALSGLLLGLGVLGIVLPSAVPALGEPMLSGAALGAGLGLEVWAVLLLIKALRAARRAAPTP